MMIWLGILSGIAAYCAYAIGRCFFRVNQGAVAVLLRFGAAEGAGGRLRTYGPGLHLKWPWQVAREVPVMEQSLELSGEEGGQSAMAADGTVLRFDSILRFTPQEAELDKYLFDMRAAQEHITGLFACLLRNEIADLRPAEQAQGAAAHRSGGSYGLIRRQRRELNRRIEEFCQKELARRYGVRFSAVDLTDILPPDELADALNAVMHAEAEADAAYSLAEAESQQRIIAAEQGVRIAREKARAAEEEIRVLARYLAELHEQGTLADYVGRRRTEVLSQAKSLYLKS